MARQKKPSGKCVEIKKPKCVLLAAKNVIVAHGGNHFQGQRNGTPHTVEVLFTLGQNRHKKTLDETVYHAAPNWRQYITATLGLE